MKRLVYAPKAYVFIRSSNLGGNIYDVSSDVVRGSVTQNVGDLSKASFELRNRYQKWVRDKETKESVFLPMDLVTIWLQRVAGRPIQVFTGYLDSVPYYQGYPGNATFTASCTLKKLAYTWFDPGLEFFNQWVLATGGWIYDPTTGEAKNPEYNWGNVDVKKEGIDTRNINDGGFAELLGRFMLEIAGWGPNDVLISELPKDLPKAAARLYNNIHDPVDADLKALAEFLGQAMGVPGYSQATNSTSTASTDGKSTQGNNTAGLATTMATVADKYNIPILVLAVAAYLLSKLQETYSHPFTDGADFYGYGLYAMRPDAHDRGDTDLMIDGYTVDQILSADVATEAFCKRLQRVKTDDLAKGARKNDEKSIVTWITLASGRPLNPNNITQAVERAKDFAGQAVVVTPKETPTSIVNVGSLDWIDKRLTKLITSPSEQAIANQYRSALAEPWLTGWLYRAKQMSPKLELAKRSSPFIGKDYIAITSAAPALLSKFFATLKGDTTIDYAHINISGQTQVMRGGNVTTQAVRRDPDLGSSNTVVIQQKTAPPKGTTTGGPGTAVSSSGVSDAATAGASGGATFEQLAAFSANSAFAANFAFPSNRIESTFLTGDRALMNDVSCLDGVKQFCQASMRTFRSLPDGRFLAFYPDYFGAYRSAYWQIRDIEIINMGIQLNDEALATHVYVTGDTFALDGQIDFLDRASTRGVATLTQAFMLDSIMYKYSEASEGDGEISRVHRMKDAWEFLQHYGARPHAEEQPLIRNTAYEFLMAWQRFMQLWASTFATTVDFTFQPEIMAGGLIEFPDHNLQMYCENVTHTFDYTSGFSTQATMSSPAHTTKGFDRSSMPGFALAGGVNTVGAA